MKKYTNEERLGALNRHRESLRIDKDGGFTVLTQHIPYENIEEFCDIIIHYEKFNAIYGEIKCCFDYNTELYKKRKEIFFNENRELTLEETELCIKIDNDFQIYLSKCHDCAQL